MCVGGAIPQQGGDGDDGDDAENSFSLRTQGWNILFKGTPHFDKKPTKLSTCLYSYNITHLGFDLLAQTSTSVCACSVSYKICVNYIMFCRSEVIP